MINADIKQCDIFVVVVLLWVCLFWSFSVRFRCSWCLSNLLAVLILSYCGTIQLGFRCFITFCFRLKWVRRWFFFVVVYSPLGVFLFSVRLDGNWEERFIYENNRFTTEFSISFNFFSALFRFSSSNLDTGFILKIAQIVRPPGFMGIERVKEIER